LYEFKADYKQCKGKRPSFQALTVLNRLLSEPSLLPKKTILLSNMNNVKMVFSQQLS